MITVTTNINAVVGFIVTKLNDATGDGGIIKDKMVRGVASTVGGFIKTRVHEDGINSDGAPFGTYDPTYLKLRKKKYGRTDGAKIILSLTTQQESDFSAVAIQPIKTSTGYGLGFKNTSNAMKAGYQKERFGRIYNLTESEKILTRNSAIDYANELIRDLNK